LLCPEAEVGLSVSRLAGTVVKKTSHDPLVPIANWLYRQTDLNCTTAENLWIIWTGSVCAVRVSANAVRQPCLADMQVNKPIEGRSQPQRPEHLAAFSYKASKYIHICGGVVGFDDTFNTKLFARNSVNICKGDVAKFSYCLIAPLRRQPAVELP
jgi:hypothetical protein